MHKQSNELVSFLIGKWDNLSFEVTDGKPVKTETYSETMIAKDFDTLIITAHEYRNGKDLSREMCLKLDGNNITMMQGDFLAKGKCENNLYTFAASINESEYRFRIYTLGDKFVFHRETWKNGNVVQVDMSYLVRK